MIISEASGYIVRKIFRVFNNRTSDFFLLIVEKFYIVVIKKIKTVVIRTVSSIKTNIHLLISLIHAPYISYSSRIYATPYFSYPMDSANAIDAEFSIWHSHCGQIPFSIRL